MQLNWMRNRNSDPLQPLSDVWGQLAEFRMHLDNIQEHLSRGQATGIDLITRFFHDVAFFQDANTLRPLIGHFIAHNKRGEFSGMILELQTLNAFVENAGRHQYGTNRTVVGQVVTDSHVFIGYDYHGVTRPLSDIKSAGPGLTYDLIDRLARAIMAGHIPTMISCLDRVIEKAR